MTLGIKGKVGSKSTVENVINAGEIAEHRAKFGQGFDVPWMVVGKPVCIGS